MGRVQNTALGMVETVGMVPAIYAADHMLKAADVELVSYENVGSTLVTIIVQGDVAAVEASVKAGAAAAQSIGKMTASNVIPRPANCVGRFKNVHALPEGEPEKMQSLALIETFGLVYLLEAADAMEKAANVEVFGYENVASGYISALGMSDVAACKASVEAGVKAVEAMGAEVYSSVVIPTPHPELARIVKLYTVN